MRAMSDFYSLSKVESNWKMEKEQKGMCGSVFVLRKYKAFKSGSLVYFLTLPTAVTHDYHTQSFGVCFMVPEKTLKTYRQITFQSLTNELRISLVLLSFVFFILSATNFKCLRKIYRSLDFILLELQVGCELPGGGAGYGTWSSGRTVHSIEC